VDNIKEFDSSNKSGTGSRIIIGILVILLMILGYLYVNQLKKTDHKIAELNQVNQEKDTLSYQFQNLLAEYEGLATTNDSISSQLDDEKERIKKIMTELRSVKAQNKVEIEKYKNELKTLRDIMKGFIHQIDSLNTLNIQLTEENVKVKEQFRSAKKENKQLNDKYTEAAGKVAKASVIKAINVSIEPLNSKGKSTNRARKTARFAINLTLDENVIAPTGTKDVYVRITDPKEHVLIHPEQPMFTYEGEQIAFSAVRQIDYEGQQVTSVIYYDQPTNDLLDGTYKVDIFCDGYMIGSSTTVLK